MPEPILFVDNLISIGFLFSPALSRYMISHWFFLDNRNWFIIVEASILAFMGILYFGGILGSDIGVPWFSFIYPLFLMILNAVFYVRFNGSQSLSLSLSFMVVFLLNAVHEVNLFTYEILYGVWIPANLLFGMIPMHPFMHIYTMVVGVWLFQTAKIRVCKGSLLLLGSILLLPFIPIFTTSIWTPSTPHHIAVSLIQFLMFSNLVNHWSRILSSKSKALEEMTVP